ncbi:MAG: lysoplasmalogenase [Chloroflexi bacterium]|nr:lysoplasmalogenase [Chloroflexota bacterium]
MQAQWLVPTLVFAALQWYARWRGHRKLHLVTKPAVPVFLIVWLWQSTNFQGFTFWIGLALFFSLLGDIFLMCPPGFFMAGLLAFLLGHIFYIAGFRATTLSGDPVYWASGLLILLLMGYVVRYYMAALKKRLVSKRIRAGVVIYIIVIHIMLFSALSTFWRPEWVLASAILVSIGAVLFCISDSMLAYDRFITKIPNAHVWIMMTYHMAQILIVAGVIRQYLWVS